MTNYKLPDSKDFEHNIQEKHTHLLTLANHTGMQIALTDYGARLVSALVPDKQGNLVDVVLGFDHIQGYLDAQEKYHGTTVGRFCNRIANGQFTLEGQKYTLEQNNGPNSLHGGSGGFHNRVWDHQMISKNKVNFHYTSADGEEGFPGELKANVSYELTEDNEIIIRFSATTDKTTIINLTNHAYFNLNGEGNGDILKHTLHVPSEKFIPINAQQISTGQENSVKETAFDFTSPKKIGEDIDSGEEQLQFAGGYDHTFVNVQPLNKAAAIAYADQSGISLEVLTSEPGIHLYTGNFLADDKGKDGHHYQVRGGFCLETQHYPDSPNHPHFPNVILRPGETFESTTIYKFGIQK